MKKPNQKRIDKEIAALEDIKPKTIHYSAFGDNHWDAIDAQIEVLQDRLTDREIDDKCIYEDDPDNGEWEESVADAARSARSWLDGRLDDYDDLISGWKELGA
jgi:hypothetical protein